MRNIFGQIFSKKTDQLAFQVIFVIVIAIFSGTKSQERVNLFASLLVAHILNKEQGTLRIYY